MTAATRHLPLAVSLPIISSAEGAPNAERHSEGWLAPMSESPPQSAADPRAGTHHYPVDRAEIVATVDQVLGWDLISRERQEPAADIVEHAVRQLSVHLVALCQSLAKHISALPRDDEMRRRALVTLTEADRRLNATTREGRSMRAQNLARMVRALSAVNDEVESRLRARRLTGRANTGQVPAVPKRGRP